MNPARKMLSLRANAVDEIGLYLAGREGEIDATTTAICHGSREQSQRTAEAYVSKMNAKPSWMGVFGKGLEEEMTAQTEKPGIAEVVMDVGALAGLTIAFPQEVRRWNYRCNSLIRDVFARMKPSSVATGFFHWSMLVMAAWNNHKTPEELVVMTKKPLGALEGFCFQEENGDIVHTERIYVQPPTSLELKQAKLI